MTKIYPHTRPRGGGTKKGGIMRCPFCNSEDLEIEGDFIFTPNSNTVPNTVELLTDIATAHCLDCDEEWELYDNDLKEIENQLKGARVYV
jgi:transcription elongation factor Elf1